MPKNKLDAAIWRMLRFDNNANHSRRISHRRRLWSNILEQIVVSLSDQQLVTGLSILIVGCSMNSYGTIDVYHFVTVTDLAWLSANTHAMSLILTRRYLRQARREPRDDDTSDHDSICLYESDRAGHRSLIGLTAWRMLCIYSTVAMLLFGLVDTSYEDLYDSFACPMRCMPLNDPGSTSLGVTIFEIASLAWGYGRILAETLLLRIRLPENVVTTIKRTWVGRSIVRGIEWILILLLSSTWTVFEQLVWFSIGTWVLYSDLSWGRSLLSKEQLQIEKEWGFGQLVPLLLLMLPFMNAAQAYVGKFNLSIWNLSIDI